jgi:DNA-binding beta-propeller fold protein YncE
LFISTVAGTGLGFSLGDGGPATAANLSSPRALAIGSDGSVYVCENQGVIPSHRVRRIDRYGIIKTIAGTEKAGTLGDGGLAHAALLASPVALALGSDGSVYISEYLRVRRIDPDGVIATFAKLSSPTGLAIGPDGSVYIADNIDNRIRKVDPNGTIATIAGTGKAGSAGDGGPATSAELCHPFCLAIGADASLYIGTADRIRRVNSNGIITTIAGTCEVQPLAKSPSKISRDIKRSVEGERRYRTKTGTKGSTREGRFAIDVDIRPSHLTIAPDGSLYVAEGRRNQVRMINPEGTITTIAGTGAKGSIGDGEPAIDSQLNWPCGLALAPDGSLYIAEGMGHRIRRVAWG